MTAFAKTFRAGEASVSVEFQFENLPPASIDFLLDYGAKQYLADAMAMSTADADKVREDGGNPDEVRVERVKKRWAALVEGTPSVRARADTMSPAERMFAAVRDEWIKLALGRAGKKLPADKEARAKWVQAFADKNRERIEKEAAKRLRDQSKVEIDLDLGDI